LYKKKYQQTHFGNIEVIKNQTKNYYDELPVEVECTLDRGEKQGRHSSHHHHRQRNVVQTSAQKMQS
jgi:hypothetical protein